MTASTFPAPPEPSMREVLFASYFAAFEMCARVPYENLKLNQASYAGLLLHVCEGDTLKAMSMVIHDKRPWFREVVEYLDRVYAEDRMKL